MDLEWLSRTVFLTHAVTAKARHGSQDFYYRDVASAGALYPFELYVGTRGVKGLDDGLYHHTLGLNALTLLRLGDVGPALEGCLPSHLDGSAMAVFFITAIFPPEQIFSSVRRFFSLSETLIHTSVIRLKNLSRPI